MTNNFFSVPDKSDLASATHRKIAFPVSKRMLIDIVSIIDMSLVVGSALLIRFLYVRWYYSSLDGLFSDGISYLGVIALVTVMLYFSLLRRGYYNIGSFESWDSKRETPRFAFTVLFSFLMALFVVFLFKASAQFSRVWVSAWCASSFLTLYFARMFWVKQFDKLSAKGYFRRRIFLLGAGRSLALAEDQLLLGKNRIALVGLSSIAIDTGSGEEHLRGTLNHVMAKVRAGGIDEVMVALPAAQSGFLEDIIRNLRLLPVDLTVVPDFGNCQFKCLDVDCIGSMNLVSIQKKPIAEWNGFQKAVEDYVLATIALIIFLPAMLVIALLIKLDSKGPVIFRQRRHGSNHKIIEVWKFRSMKVMEDGENVKQASKDDDRITRVGRILRKTSLDELPQLLNVLAGDMSLVGPRPHALTHNDQYTQLLDNYAGRHRVKPGITGWAQVHGLRGEITAPELMEQRLRYDLEYIDNWSIWFDLQILLWTVIFGFVSKTAY
jgi:putative colanic acid biosysnthesis UDP-glucose lipid carrier transferase